MTTTIERAPATLGHLRVPEHARDAIGAALMTLPDPTTNADQASARLLQIFGLMPTAQIQKILDFGRHSDTPGVMHVRNLPADPVLPPTPIDGAPSTAKQTYVAEGVLLGLTGLIGEPVGFTTEKAGQLVHDVVPVATGATSQTNQGSRVFLNFHNDIVHDDIGRYDLSSPDFLVLSCLRQDPAREAVTYYADARDICAALPSDTVATLRRPVFRLNAPGSYVRSVAGGADVWSEPVPLITGPETAPEIAASANGVDPLTSPAREAFAALTAICDVVAHQVRLEPGTALLINNRKGLHARSQFPARHDGTDRWLQRTYVRRSLWSIRYRALPGARRVH